MKFECDSCGLCCQNIGSIKTISEEIALSLINENVVFTYKEVNGMCEKFIDNKCSVYENRPLICNVEKMAELLSIEKSEFYKENTIACNDLKWRNDSK